MNNTIYFTLFQERDPNNNIPPPVIGGYSPTIIGDEPPDFVRLEEICPQTVYRYKWFLK